MLVKSRKEKNKKASQKQNKKSKSKKPKPGTSQSKSAPRNVKWKLEKNSVDLSTVYPVILSGGSGTRLWPLSRSMFPKQFIKFFTGQRKSFLSEAIERLSPRAGFNAPIILCNNDHRFLVKQELEAVGIKPHAIVLEPIARNTAPAIAVAALKAMQSDPEAIIVVMPSDHIVNNPTQFATCVANAAKIAKTEKLVLFGIKPTQPHTGYGYIKKGASLDDCGAAFNVSAFYEKPNLATAKKYLASGDYFWNSGIFVLHARTFLDELETLEPSVFTASKDALKKYSDDLGFERLDQNAFAASPNISVDYAVMEKTRKSVMLPIDVGWNDVGSWSSLWDIAERDDDENFIRGEAITHDTSGCYIHSEKSLVATIGIDDLIIIDTPDALLVADRSRAQDVASIVGELKSTGRKEQEQHLRNFRPWGFFETLSLGTRFQVKLLHVKPGGKLSMQMHHHRSEHWIVVQGTAKVQIGDIEKLVRENESVYIYSTQWHRLENPGKVPLEMIEVQIGTYLGEDDIIRSEDIYKRADHETK